MRSNKLAQRQITEKPENPNTVLITLEEAEVLFNISDKLEALATLSGYANNISDGQEGAAFLHVFLDEMAEKLRPVRKTIEDRYDVVKCPWLAPEASDRTPGGAQ